MSSGTDEWDDRKAREALLHRARIEGLKETFRKYYRDARDEAIYEGMFKAWLDRTSSQRR
jgi:hypothetical protein